MKISLRRAKILLAVWFAAAALVDSVLVHGAAPKTQLRVAYSSISGAGIVTWLAVDKGLFAKHDLDVELIYVAGSQAMQSLLGGRRPSASRASSRSFA